MGSFSREDVSQKYEGIPSIMFAISSTSEAIGRNFNPVARATTESLPTHPEPHAQHRPASSKIADSLSNRFCHSHRGTAWRRRVPGIGAEFERSAAVWSVSDDRI